MRQHNDQSFHKSLNNLRQSWLIHSRLILYNRLNDYFLSLMLRSVPALRRILTFFDNGWLVVSLAPALASSSARCANGSTFSEPPVPLKTKFEPMVAVRPPELEAPRPKRGFLKIEYCKEVTRSAKDLQSV